MAEFDIVIHGGRLIDGTGNPWFYGDVAIKAGKIAGIGKIDPGLGQRSISAKGRVVTPGYIDMLFFSFKLSIVFMSARLSHVLWAVKLISFTDPPSRIRVYQY